MLLIKRNGGLAPVNRIFSDLFDSDTLFNSSSFPDIPSVNIPAANVKEETNQFVVQLAAPGFSKKDFKIDLENNVLVVSAKKEEEKKEVKKNYTKQEFNYSSFERSFSLPETVNADSINAEYKDGMLNLVIPKKEESVKKLKKQIAVS